MYLIIAVCSAPSLVLYDYSHKSGIVIIPYVHGGADVLVLNKRLGAW